MRRKWSAEAAFPEGSNRFRVSGSGDSSQAVGVPTHPQKIPHRTSYIFRIFLE